MSSVTHSHGSSTVKLTDYVCAGSNRTPCAAEFITEYEIVFVRRGVFTMWANRRQRTVTANELLFLQPGTEYAASHPIRGGDDCTIITPMAGLLDSVRLPDAPVHVVTAPPGLFRQQWSLLHQRARGAVSPLEMEEHLVGIVASSLVLLEGRDHGLAVTPQQRRRIQRVQELIAEHCTSTLKLTAIAEVAGLSPFHLSRVFRRVTGTSIHQYQSRLRLRLGLSMLAQGADDIATIALDLGYSSHSHFTAAFRREFGLPPTRFRRSHATLRDHVV
jgi:AraC family transcriptional regulator